jgi:hypothetical protein
MFTPVSQTGGDTGNVAVGQIGSDGAYSLTTFDEGDGAVLGQHVVTVETQKMTMEQLKKQNLTPDGRIIYKMPKPAVPSKYTSGQSSPLRYTVSAGGNTIDIDLQD